MHGRRVHMLRARASRMRLVRAIRGDDSGGARRQKTSSCGRPGTHMVGRGTSWITLSRWPVAAPMRRAICNGRRRRRRRRRIESSGEAARGRG